MSRFVALFIACVLPLPCAMDPLPCALIVWNVGQGSWATLRCERTCQHFDAGGERAPWSLITEACRGRRNLLYFSHWDYDHVRFTPQVPRRLGVSCVSARPGGEAPRKRARLIAGLEACAISPDASEVRSRVAAHSANDASRVFVVEGVALLPGDAPSKMERGWRLPTSIGLLLSGHHGSRTSTSDALLAHLPRLKQAIASARKEKYGHPHPIVSARLRAHGVAELRTEDWGSIYWHSRALREDAL